MVLMAVLVALMLVSGALAMWAPSARDAQQREREAELLFVGEQYRAAIQSFVRQSPIGGRRYPASLAELVNDQRFPNPRHHLRKLFHDPMAPDQDWELIRAGNGIVGVRSRSTLAPFKKAGFTELQRNFGSAQRYADWEFKLDGPAPGASAPLRTL